MVKWLLLWEMDTVTGVQILNKTVGISYWAHIILKVLQPSNLSSAMDEIIRQTGLFNLRVATSLGKGKH